MNENIEAPARRDEPQSAPQNNLIVLAYGALGGLTPKLVALGTGDHSRIFQDMTAFSGLIFSIIILGFLGSIMTHLFSTPGDDRKKLFIMGMGAPSLLAAFVVSANAPQRTSSFSGAILSSAFAQPTAVISGTNSSERPHIYNFCRPRAPQLARFIGGFTGIMPNTLNQFWVVEYFDHRENAKSAWGSAWERAAMDGSLNEGGTKPRLFAFNQGNNNWRYLLSLGINLDESAAKLRAQNYSSALGRRFEAIRLSDFISRHNINSDALEECRFLHDPTS